MPLSLTFSRFYPQLISFQRFCSCSPGNPMIPEDHGTRGIYISTSHWPLTTFFRSYTSMHKSTKKPEPYKLTQPFSLNIPRCRHLKVNGTQCGSPALKDHRFCFFHQQWHERKLLINSARARRARASISLPVLEDANAIQLSVMQIMQLLLEGQIPQKTAGLLFYGLQIASSNLKHINFEPETKNEIVIDPRKTAETRLGQPLWKNGDFEETADGKINLDDYDLTDLTIRVIDQMK